MNVTVVRRADWTQWAEKMMRSAIKSPELQEKLIPTCVHESKVV